MKSAMSGAAVVLMALAASGCKSDEQGKASETNLTSATTPAPAVRDDLPPPEAKASDVAGAPAGNAPVLFEADQIKVTQADRERALAAERAAKTNTQKASSPAPTQSRLRPGDPGFTGGVAPGHIMWPPGNETGTGNPNSDGSHNIGSSTAP
jgi:hypothetical protein